MNACLLSLLASLKTLFAGQTSFHKISISILMGRACPIPILRTLLPLPYQPQRHQPLGVEHWGGWWQIPEVWWQKRLSPGTDQDQQDLWVLPRRCHLQLIFSRNTKRIRSSSVVTSGWQGRCVRSRGNRGVRGFRWGALELR